MFGFSSGQFLVVVLVCLIVLGPAKTVQTLSFIFEKISGVSQYIRKIKREIDIQTILDQGQMSPSLASAVKTVSGELDSISESVQSLSYSYQNSESDSSGKKLSNITDSLNHTAISDTAGERSEVYFEVLENCRNEIEKLEAELLEIKNKLESYADHEKQ
ncbi:MAG: hypothetical protein ACI4UM_01695 [Succinivibrio sp.]